MSVIREAVIKSLTDPGGPRDAPPGSKLIYFHAVLEKKIAKW